MREPNPRSNQHDIGEKREMQMPCHRLNSSVVEDDMAEGVSAWGLFVAARTPPQHIKNNTLNQLIG